MTKYNVYKVQTDIPTDEDSKTKGTLLAINVLADTASNAAYNVSNLKYNGESIDKHIISISLSVKDVIQYGYNEEINPNYVEPESDEPKTDANLK